MLILHQIINQAQPFELRLSVTYCTYNFTSR
uniref:Uncharacterized protein n=1 Tax=Rhizophora mucronata TaxID=61149 RepID=A0A2P2R148_RHIMU